MTTTNDTRDGSTSAPSAGSDADFVADTNRSFLSRLYTGTGAFEIVGRRRMWYLVSLAIVALPISMIVAVVAEMLMGGYGLGGAMMTASRFADSRGVFAGIVEIAIVGYVLIKLMAILRRRLLIWHQEANAPATT